MRTHSGRLVVMIVLPLVAGVSCGTNTEERPPGAAADGFALDANVTCLPVVDASDVIVSGDLDPDQLEIVDWALGRFALAGLRLPEKVAIGFDPTRVACAGKLGRCEPNGNNVPTAWVCEAEGESFHRVREQRLTLLHELGHIWHWTLGDGETWLDLSPVVGGSLSGADDEVAWSQRSEERVAMVIAWGLLDQERRPVRSPKGCVLLYEEFQALTGVEPLGSLEPVCVPED